jgi:RNA polymerase sigma-70 factor (ECF subfamily)
MTCGTARRQPTRHRLRPEAIDDHRSRLFRAAYGLCGSHADAEDLVQETFERVLRRPRFVKPNHDRAYLLRVLRHVWVAHVRSAAHRTTTPMPPENLEWLADRRAGPELALDAQLAYQAMSDLSEPLRLAVVAVDVVGLSYAEAARSLHTRKGTIMSRLFRAREQLAGALEAT